MHTLDNFALNCGLKASSPYIMEKFFPLNSKSYIVFYPFGSSNSRSYDYWRDVIKLIHPMLRAENIDIIQIGAKDSQKLEGCIDLTGQVDFNQTQYLIRRSRLLLAADSFVVHQASSLGKKIVSLYSDSSPLNTGPYWSKKKDVVCLESKTEGKIYSYAEIASPKTINEIYPENIAKAVAKLLRLKLDYPYETLNIGDQYHNLNVESVPSITVNIDNIQIDSIIVRMDLNFDQSLLVHQLQQSSCSIITDKYIDNNILTTFKQRLAQFVFLIKDKSDEELESDYQYIQGLYKIGVQCLLLSEEVGETLNKLKLKFLDYCPIHSKPNKSKDDYTFLKGKDTENLYYKSSRFLIKDGQAYYCEAAMREGVTVPSVGFSDPQKVIDSPLFWKESDKFTILEKH